MTDVEIARVAEAAHAQLNCGVDLPWSPLSWQSEGPIMRAWWINHTKAVLAALDPPETEDARVGRFRDALIALGVHDFDNGGNLGTPDRPCRQCKMPDRHPLHTLLA